MKLMLILLTAGTSIWAQKATAPGRDAHILYQTFFELQSTRATRVEQQANGNGVAVGRWNQQTAKELGLTTAEWAKALPIIRQGHDNALKVRGEWRASGLPQKASRSADDRRAVQRFRNREAMATNDAVQRLRTSLGPQAWAKLSQYVNSTHKNRFQQAALRK